MSNEKVQVQKPEIVGTMGLTEPAKENLIYLLNVARKKGTEEEAVMALNYISEIRTIVHKTEQAKEEADKKKKEQAIEKDLKAKKKPKKQLPKK